MKNAETGKVDKAGDMEDMEDAAQDWQHYSDDENVRLEEACEEYDDVVDGDVKDDEEEEEDDYHEILFGDYFIWKFF